MDTHVALKVVWSWVLVLSVGAEWADVARRLVDETMPYHLILTLESFTTLSSWASVDWAVMGPSRRMYIAMRVQQILRLKRRSSAALEGADEARWRVRDTVYAHPVNRRKDRRRALDISHVGTAAWNISSHRSVMSPC